MVSIRGSRESSGFLEWRILLSGFQAKSRSSEFGGWKVRIGGRSIFKVARILSAPLIKFLVMSGSGGGGGYEYQAQATAYVAAHILAKRPLHWIEHRTPDVPIAVAEETDGPGDDIKITLQDGSVIELQAKHGLKKNEKFWEAIVKLARGLVEDCSLYGVLLTDSTASSTIRDELREGIERLGQGREDNLKAITQEVIDRLSREGISYSSDIFRRLRIVIVDLDNSQRDAKTALVLLSQVLNNPEQARQAWKVLFTEGMSLITKKGRCNGASLLRLLGGGNIQLSSEKAQADSVKRYQQLQRAMQESKVRCIDQWEYLGVSRSDAIAFADDLSIGILPANLELYPGKLIILTGKLGSGKSLIGERLFQSMVQKVLEGIDAPIPIRFEAREIQKYRSLVILTFICSTNFSEKNDGSVLLLDNSTEKVS